MTAPTSDYTDAEGNILTLRGSLTPATRQEYATVLKGNPLSQEDAWHRAVEFLFERLAVRWEISGAPIKRQREAAAALPRRKPGGANLDQGRTEGALRGALPRRSSTLIQ